MIGGATELPGIDTLLGFLNETRKQERVTMIAKDGVAVHFTSPVRQDDAPRQHREAVAKFCGEG